ncbi:hypothetical protein [Xanthomonas hortorum]|uniref:hypothetical protein n=1 Tax=Xanthomonas hortorum TaxID=56454 RepID=UPI0015932571|nr:hypothetical protein [Xanthomonas hortorum]NHF67674.1 hypothetical protein [Xanthomonas hortorum]
MKLILGTTLFLCMLASVPAAAQQAERLEFQRAATGQRFKIGDTDFRLVPGARIQRQVQAGPRNEALDTPGARRASAAGNVGIPARVGPYVLTLGQAARNAASSPAGTADEAPLMVAVNQRNGQPVVASPRLEVYASDADAIARLARQTNGTVLEAAQDGTGMIGYPSVPTALAALPTVRRGGGVSEAVLHVIQAVPRLR